MCQQYNSDETALPLQIAIIVQPTVNNNQNRLRHSTIIIGRELYLYSWRKYRHNKIADLYNCYIIGVLFFIVIV